MSEPTPVVCLICGSDDESAAEYAHLGGMEVCFECADRVANAFYKKHSGRYLTWDNPPLQRAFVKQPIPEALRWEVFERDGFKCKSCPSRSFLRADHVIPESKGGPTTIENLQTLCRSCNSRKGVRLDGGA